jgi:hypothetical protein
MKKIYIALLPLLCGGLLYAQTNNDGDSLKNEKESLKEGQNKFAIFGNGEMKFISDKNTVQFGDVNFKPIFLWKISDKLFVEAEPEFETGGGSLDIGLEYANMCYFVSKNLILYAGRFLPKFGAYRGRMGEAFVNRFPTDPVGFGDGGIGAMNEVGIGAQGAFQAGDGKFNYNFYISNGPLLLTDTSSAGQFEYEAYVGNNKGKAVGGRIGYLPFSNSCLEIGFSFQTKKNTGDAGTPYEKVSVNMQAVDLNFYNHITGLKSDVRLIAEWKHQKVSNATYYDAGGAPYTFTNSPSAYYITGTIRPVHVDNEFVHNLELAARYSEFKRPLLAPWGGDDTHQFAVSLDYWLKWNCLVKLTYQTQKDEPKVFLGQVVFGF